MKKRIEPQEQELRDIVRKSRAELAQAEALLDLEDWLPEYIDSNSQLALIAADTVVFENYRNPQLCLAWLTSALSAWLRANARFNRLSGRSLLYRYILLPSPSSLSKPIRRALIDAILLHLHLQLWHGVICCVIFADPKRTSLSDVTRVLNFLAIPTHGLLYDVPSFYRSDNIRSSLFEGAFTRHRLDEIRDLINKIGNHHWLYYDEINFDGPRLEGWRREAFRKFIWELYGPNPGCMAMMCKNKATDFDHIAPVSKKYFQTIINFQPLCSPCNKAKGASECEDPYRPRILIPDGLATRDLDDIFRKPPPWLGSLRRPRSKRELFVPDLGLK